jgi:hypothetical protein
MGLVSSCFGIAWPSSMSSHSNNTSRTLPRHYFNIRRDLRAISSPTYPDSLAVRLNSDLRAQTIQQEAQRAKPSPTFPRARLLFSAVRKSLSNDPSLLRQSTAPFKIPSYFVDVFIGIVVRHKLNSEPLRLFLGGFDDPLPLSAAS